ncbi:MAG: aspartyl/asparaginyl beta-hydroxylase domain-containing protein [Bacteroidetes bacterium]|nr:aspartyl/asparaginyl beta-hydroxylase domain-containing protein [Bacteroidota bacterium]
MIQYLQLKKQFDSVAMQEEVSRLAANWWKEHYNKAHYQGSWSVIPLRAAGGDPGNIYSIHISANQTLRYEDTPLLKDCPIIQSALDFFECEKTSVRLMKLNAGAVIKEHTDQDMHFEEGEARFHIPVITNDLVDFFIEEEKIPMKEGECWYLNLSMRHRVTNSGATDRIHLVIDCIVNDWIKHLFETATALRKDTDRDRIEGRQMSLDEKKKMIVQLRELNTPVANELADKMEAENI